MRTRLRLAAAISLIAVAAVASGFGWIYLVANEPAERMLIVARRGDISLWPENTLEAIRSAADLGAPGIEFDVGQSSDGTFFLMHDPTVDRTTTGRGPLSSLSDAVVSELRITGGLGYEEHHVDLRVPRLVEVLDALIDYDGLMVLDAKPGIDHVALAQLVIQRGLADLVWLSCYSPDQCDGIAGVSPDLVTNGPPNSGAEYIRVGSPLPLRAFFWEHVVTAVDEWHDGDETEYLERARRWGVEVYITNDLPGAIAWMETSRAGSGR